ncbi:MAG: PDZ domain-containing protein [Bacteroidetes bacterium]|nr:PDZ domain-containing protein [Bacteroidota bacterium]
MKKYLNLFLVAITSAFLAVLISQFVHQNSEVISRESIQTDRAPVIQSSYNSSEAVTGPDFRLAADRSIHAVVHIRTQFMRKTNSYEDFFDPLRELLEGRSRQQEYAPMIGFGSGVIVSNDGYIVTNNHVVEGGSMIEVTLNDKRLYEAELIGRDPSTDLALIKIKEEDLPYLIYGNSDEVQIGEWVLAVGNPFNLTSTVTAGIVSAKARNINTQGSNTAIESFIQTDAVVNRGNSGGALVNNGGKLIGINAAIASRSGTYEGYSFAIPVNIVKKVMNDLLKYGEIQRAFIGITIRDITAEFAKDRGIDQLQGVYIDDVVASSGADLAGIEAGDVIVRIDNIDIASSSELLETIGQHHPGDKIEVLALRNNKEKEFSVTLQNENGTTGITSSEDEFRIDEFGTYFKLPTAKLRSELKINNGLSITRLDDGILKEGGIRKGFIVLRINDSLIRAKRDIDSAIQHAHRGEFKIEGIYPNGMRIIYGFGQ